MSYSVFLADQPNEYIRALDEKSANIIKDNLRKLEDDPYPRPGSGSGDKEKVPVDGEEVYRLHISRTHTAFYRIIEDKNQVRIIELLSIDDAHDRYGF